MSQRPLGDLSDPETLLRLIHNLPAAVYVTNDQGRILDANPACLALLGARDLDELAHVTASRLFSDPQDRRRELATLEATGAIRQYEIRLRRLDGEERTVLDSCYAVLDPESGEKIYHGLLLDITDRKRLEEQLRELTHRDPLTGCYNRRYLETLERRGGFWGVVVVDVDHFKHYNDRHGHDSGDDVLRRVVRFLERNISASDAVVRLGGDEFLVVVEGEDAEHTGRILERLEAKKGEAPVPVSMGFATRQGEERLERTISRADHQLLDRRRRRRSSAEVRE